MTEVQAPVQGPVKTDLTPPQPVIPTESADSADPSQTIEAANAVIDALQNQENLNIPEDQRLYESSQLLKVVSGRTRAEGKRKKAETTPGKEALNTVAFIMDHQSDPDLEFKEMTDITRDPPLIIRSLSGVHQASERIGTEITQINEKKVVNGKVYFVCTLGVGDKAQRVQIDSDELIRAQVFSEGAVMLEAIKDPETRSLMTKYFDHLKDPTESFNVDDVQIKEAAIRNGMISSESAKVMAASIADETVRARILSDLEGRNIASIENVTEIMMHASTMGVEKQAITTEIEGMRSIISDNQEKIRKSEIVGSEASKRLISQYEAEIAHFEAQIVGKKEELEDLEKFQGAMTKYQGDLIKAIKSAYDGSMDLSAAQGLDKAIRDKDMTKLMETLVSQLGDDKRSQELKEMAASALKMGGIGALAIVALMIMQAVTAKQ